MGNSKSETSQGVTGLRHLGSRRPREHLPALSGLGPTADQSRSGAAWVPGLGRQWLTGSGHPGVFGMSRGLRNTGVCGDSRAGQRAGCLLLLLLLLRVLLNPPARPHPVPHISSSPLAPAWAQLPHHGGCGSVDMECSLSLWQGGMSVECVSSALVPSPPACQRWGSQGEGISCPTPRG